MSLVNLNQINIIDSTLNQATDGSIPVALKTGGNKWSGNYTGGILVPSGNSSQRITNPITGHMRFNTDFNELEIFSGAVNNWGSLTKYTQNGSAVDPSRTFVNDPQSGMYLENPGILAFSANSLKRLAIDGAKATILDQLQINGVENNNSANMRILTPNNQSGTIYWGDTDDDSKAYIRYNHVTNEFEFSAFGGTPAFDIDGTNNTTTFTGDVIFNGNVAITMTSFSSPGDLIGIIDSDGTDTTSVFKIQHDAAIDTGFSVTQQGNVRAAPNSNVQPAYSFDGFITSGIFYDTANNEIGFSIGGNEEFSIGSSFNISYVPIIIPNGSASNPTLTFDSDNSTGIYSSGPGIVSISTSSSENLRIDTTNTTVSNNLISKESLFLGDNSTGMEILPATMVVLLGGQTDVAIGSPLTYVATDYEMTVFEYVINRTGLGMKSGSLQIVTDGTTLDYSETSIDLNSNGIDFNVVINGSNVEIRYTSTAGINATMKYVLRRMGI